MILIQPEGLPHDVKNYLASRQNIINSKMTYESQVSEGKKEWNNKSVNYFGAGESVRKSLAESCTGLERCHYCEDSLADQIEHIYPKDLYPKKVFDWDNYLYVCGRCNGAYKNNKFAVFDKNDEVVDITRPPRAKVVQPLDGDTVFIDIRKEDPSVFFALDFSTGVFVVLADAGTRNYKRACYTRDTIQLNRDLLKQARKNRYKELVALLRDYVAEDQKGPGSEAFQTLKDLILKSAHRSVWEQMKIFHRVSDLDGFFSSAPELKDIR